MHRCAAESLGLDGERADFALAFWMVHEVPDAEHLLGEASGLLEPEGRLLLVEPRGHVRADAWARTLDVARGAGFILTGEPRVALSRAALLQRRT